MLTKSHWLIDWFIDWLGTVPMWLIYMCFFASAIPEQRAMDLHGSVVLPIFQFNYDMTWTIRGSSGKWNHFCSRISKPRRFVTHVFCALEILLFTYLLAYLLTYVMLCYSYCSPTLTVINSHECYLLTYLLACLLKPIKWLLFSNWQSCIIVFYYGTDLKQLRGLRDRPCLNASYNLSPKYAVESEWDACD